MTDKRRKLSLGKSVKFFLNAVMVVPALLNLVKTFFSLVESEAQLAARGIIKILVCLILLMVILTVTWMCLLSILVVCLVNYAHLSWLLSLSAVFILNLFVIIIISLLISRYKQDVSFAKTTQLLSDLNPLHRD